MSGHSQPDHEDAVQELHQWIRQKSTVTYNIVTGARDPKGTFLPAGTVEEYLRDNDYENTKALIKAVCPKNITVHAGTVAREYPRSFCILVQLHKAKFISTFVKYEELSDAQLPFMDPEQAPPCFPVVDDNGKFYKDFFAKQWHFLAPKLKRRVDARILPYRILPFISLERVGDGRSASVYRADVHPKHDDLNGPPNIHCYALKTYKTTTASDDFERESKAFAQSTEHFSIDPQGLIAFYGSFKYDKTWVLLLEFADGGNLEEFFQREPEPKSGEAMIELWESLFDLIKGIFTIHQHYLGSSESGPELVLQGWHHDLKPDNVLVCRKKSNDGWLFKITDLGLSQFKAVMAGGPEATDLHRFGTRTYGPPECYVRSTFTERSKNDVKRSIDIWALGCIYSEAVVWGVKGRAGLKNYRHRRKIEADHLRTQKNFHGGDCFHDGIKRLSAIDAEHDDIEASLGEHDFDFISGRVINNMIVEMLEPQPSIRPSAGMLDVKAETAIRGARKALVSRKASQASPDTNNAGTDSQENSPTISSRYGEPRGSHRTSDASGMAGKFVRNTITQSPVGTISIRPGEQNIYSSHRGMPSVSEGAAQSRQQSQVVSPIYDRPQAQQSPPASRQTLDPEMEDRLRREFSTHLQMGSAATTMFVAGGLAGVADSSVIQNESSLSPKRKKADLPMWTRGEAKGWYDKMHYGINGAKIPHDYLMNRLDKRDFVFIVDDSASMDPHWNDLVDLIRVLGYITKKKDPDGVELLTLRNSKSRRTKSSDTLAGWVRILKRQGESSLDWALQQHLTEYAERIDKWTSKSLGSLFRKKPRKRNVYIFTDGMLGLGSHDQGQASIRHLVSRLKEANLYKSQIGIQFIRFGEDDNGMKRLEGLDNLQRTLGLPLDIVDTEPSNGNVWKMLLGAIDARFDNDDSDDEQPATAGPSSSARPG